MQYQDDPIAAEIERLKALAEFFYGASSDYIDVSMMPGRERHNHVRQINREIKRLTELREQTRKFAHHIVSFSTHGDRCYINGGEVSREDWLRLEREIQEATQDKMPLNAYEKSTSLARHFTEIMRQRVKERHFINGFEVTAEVFEGLRNSIIYAWDRRKGIDTSVLGYMQGFDTYAEMSDGGLVYQPSH